MTETSSSPSSAPLGTVIRVCRKRAGDPAPSLFVKRARDEQPLLFKLFTSQSDPSFHLPDTKVVDYDSKKNVKQQKVKTAKENEPMIVCNGVPLVPVQDVYDFYQLIGNHDVELGDDFEVLYGKVEDEEESEKADDDDDSNAEDNWRNDYPDEESEDSDKEDFSDDDKESDLSLDMDRCDIEDSDEDY